MTLAFLRFLARSGAEDLHPLGRAASDHLLARLELCPTDRVLEIGCGPGRTLAELTARSVSMAVGVDALPLMLARAQRRGLRCLAQATGAHLPFANQAFHKVYTESVLGFQSAATARALLAEVWRVLTPGGLYVANEAVWNARATSAVVQRLNATGERDFGLRMAAELCWHAADWQAVMRAAGFEVRACEALTAPASTANVPPGSRWARWSHYWRTGTVREALRYKWLMYKHRHDGQYVEALLFVLKKPAPTPC